MTENYPTGLTELDATFGGLRRGELTVIAGPSSKANAEVLAAISRGLHAPALEIDTPSSLHVDEVLQRVSAATSPRPTVVLIESLRAVHGLGPGTATWGPSFTELAVELDVALLGTWLTPDRPSNQARCADLYNTVAEDPGLLITVDGDPDASGVLDVTCARIHDPGMPTTHLAVPFSG